MKQRISLVLIVVLTVFLSVLLVMAEGTDDQGNPNDPHTNERANACYDGGSMEGKCDTDWEWVCGWYLIRLETGIYSRDEVPSFCSTLLPPLPLNNSADDSVVVDTGFSGFSGCGSVYYIYGFWVDDVLPNGSPLFYDADCTTPYGILWSDFVIAPNAATALAMCQAINPSYVGVSDYTNSWQCDL